MWKVSVRINAAKNCERRKQGEAEIHCVNGSLGHKKIWCSSEIGLLFVEVLTDGWLDQWTCRDDRKRLKYKCNESLWSGSLMIAISLKGAQ